MNTEYQILALPEGDAFGLIATTTYSDPAGMAKKCGAFVIGHAIDASAMAALQRFLHDAKSAGNTLADFVERLGPKAT